MYYLSSIELASHMTLDKVVALSRFFGSICLATHFAILNDLISLDYRCILRDLYPAGVHTRKNKQTSSVFYILRDDEHSSGRNAVNHIKSSNHCSDFSFAHTLTLFYYYIKLPQGGQRKQKKLFCICGRHEINRLILIRVAIWVGH